MLLLKHDFISVAVTYKAHGFFYFLIFYLLKSNHCVSMSVVNLD